MADQSKYKDAISVHRYGGSQPWFLAGLSAMLILSLTRTILLERTPPEQLWIKPTFVVFAAICIGLLVFFLLRRRNNEIVVYPDRVERRLPSGEIISIPNTEMLRLTMSLSRGAYPVFELKGVDASFEFDSSFSDYKKLATELSSRVREIDEPRDPVQFR